MNTFAKAAVLVGPRKIEVQQFAIPEIGADDGLLQIEACGVCGADIDPFINGGTSGHLGLKPPVILGHEIVGRIEKIGENAARRWNVKKGDRVILERWIPCGHCNNCYSGKYNRCVQNVNGHELFYGGTSTGLEPSLWGGYAEYLYMHPNSVVYKVADEPPAALYPLFTPLGNTISWLHDTAGLKIGMDVLIEGPGQEGLCAVIAARAAGAKRIIISGLKRDERRLNLAKELGATHTIVADEENVVEVLKAITGGEMMDVTLDVTSGANTIPVATAIEATKEGGKVVLAALHSGAPANFPTDLLVTKKLELIGVWSRRREAVFAAINIINSGEYPIEKLVSHKFNLEQANEALEMVSGNTSEFCLHASIEP